MTIIQPIPNCAECVHVMLLNGANFCFAPQLPELLDSGNDGEPCQCARSFKAACGADGRWFVRRIEFRYSYVCDCWKNNGQGCDAHDPQARLPEQSSGESHTLSTAR